MDHNRTHGVNGTEDVTVGGDRTTLFKSNETHTTDHGEEYRIVGGIRVHAARPLFVRA